MATCPVCGGDLPTQRGPRARRYCSRACQAKAYRARQRQRDTHRLAPADEDRLLAQYDGVPSLELADHLALAARRLAGALTAGLPADDFDLGVVARIPAVLAARAHQAAPAAQALHGIPDRQATPTATVIDLVAHASAATGPAPAGRKPTPAEPSRDDWRSAPAPRPARRTTKASRDGSDTAAPPQGIEPRPQKLAKKKADAIVGAAELVRDPEHRENHQWVLRSGDTVLGYVIPSYGGASRSGRNGWVGRLAGSNGERRTTRQSAAADLTRRWLRLVTATPRRSITGG